MMTHGVNPLVKMSEGFKRQMDSNLNELHELFIEEIERKRGGKITIVSI